MAGAGSAMMLFNRTAALDFEKMQGASKALSGV